MKFLVRSEGTIFEVLREMFPGASNNTLRQMLRRGRVTLEGETLRRADVSVRAGQTVLVGPARSDAPRPPGRILFQDRYLLAAEKPAGILTVARAPGDDTFYRRLNAFVQSVDPDRRVFIVHRLDREASGILLFAFDPLTQERMQRAWGSTDKRYFALVEGSPPEDSGIIRSWLHEDRFHRVYSGPEDPAARFAVTEYRVRRTGPAFSLLEVRIRTGRKNQIRVHLSELGCPIVGDRRYGARGNPIGRLGLHACYLGFTHPTTGEPVRLRLPLPRSFRTS
jgi:23S rRNA pseudouridine1911/1915/1917 synthase